MKIRIFVALGILCVMMTGCGTSATQTAQAEPAKTLEGHVAYKLGSIKKGDNAICAVCSTRGEHFPQIVQATVDHNGQTYALCTEKEQETFLANPDYYAK